jgi:hypothetical protein
LSLSSAVMHTSTSSDCDVLFESNPYNPYLRILRSTAVVCPFFFEGLSNTILESLYLKRPVLASSNLSTLFIQQSISPALSSVVASSTSMLRLLPHPDSSNLLIWVNALADICTKDSSAKMMPMVLYLALLLILISGKIS